jgi:tetratricopeptide (TPR) repeat protein
MSLEPGRTRSYNGLANSFYAQGKYDSALFYAGQALEMDSTVVYSHLIKARALAKRYYYKDAVQEYEHILSMDSTYTIAGDELEKLDRKIAYLRSLKKYNESREELKMIKPLKPKALN